MIIITGEIIVLLILYGLSGIALSLNFDTGFNDPLFNMVMLVCPIVFLISFCFTMVKTFKPSILSSMIEQRFDIVGTIYAAVLGGMLGNSFIQVSHSHSPWYSYLSISQVLNLYIKLVHHVFF